MTAQIAILNRRAVALATDSAATISNDISSKAFATANKLFRLTEKEPTGIMIYNNANFLGISWEILIKTFRERTDLIAGCLVLEDYADAFFEYLGSCEFLKNLDVTSTVVSIAESHFRNISKETNAHLEQISTERALDEETFKETLIETTRNYSAKIDEYGSYSAFRELSLESYRDSLTNIVVSSIPQNTLEKDEIFFIVKVLEKAILSQKFSDYFTGVVFAGYGKKDILPKCINYEVECMLESTIKYKKVKESNLDNSHFRGGSTAEIIPFAQKDMVELYITGVHPNSRNILDSILKELLLEEGSFGGLTNFYEQSLQHNKVEIPRLSEDQKNILNLVGNNLYQSIYDNFQHLIQQHQISPMLNVVSSLDKNKLAELAETLINLTSIRREISMDIETVGGPVDVAVISKDDGFIWMKRKHYFDPNLNNHYFK